MKTISWIRSSITRLPDKKSSEKRDHFTTKKRSLDCPLSAWPTNREEFRTKENPPPGREGYGRGGPVKLDAASLDAQAAFLMGTAELPFAGTSSHPEHMALRWQVRLWPVVIM